MSDVFTIRHGGMSRMAIIAAISALVLLLIGAVDQPASGAVPVPAASAASWAMAGHDLSNDRYNPDESALGINNVAALTQRWSKTVTGTIAATPAVVGGTVYFPDSGGTFWALNSGSGMVRWSHQVGDWTGHPGDSARATPAIADGKLFVGDHHSPQASGAYLIAANASTGAGIWKTVVDPNPSAKITGAPVVSNGVVYVGMSDSQELQSTCCSWRGSVVAVDENTGKVRWRTMTAPVGYTGAAVWGSAPVIDIKTGLLYIGTGNNYSVPEGVCTAPAQTGCLPPDPKDYVDSLLALRLDTGTVAWSLKTLSSDVYSVACLSPTTCGPDFDFGSGPNLFTVGTGTAAHELVGIGQKSGIYWAVNAVTGTLVWQTRVGPGGPIGGIQWGTATDGTRIYVATTNSNRVSYTLQPSHVVTMGGAFSALNPATGAIIWQTADPQAARDFGMVSVANGVVYGGSDAVSGPDMFALNATTGQILWSHSAGGSIMGGAAIVDGSVYWASGYYTKTCADGTSNCSPPNVMHAFGLPAGPNLVVTGISAAPASPVAGAAVTFSATVKNIGTVATPAGTILGVIFKVDMKNASWSDDHTTSLAPGASTTLTANSGPSGMATWKAVAGSHTLFANVDDVNRIVETNEGDNTLARSFMVRS